MKHVVIFDIDDTLAYAAMKRGPFDYHLVSGDEPLEDIVRLAQVLGGEHELWFWTGREESCRADTAKWLQNNLGFLYFPGYQLRMRPNGDRQSGRELKQAWLREMLPLEQIWLVVEDQPSVARMYREHGITCLCVGSEDYR